MKRLRPICFDISVALFLFALLDFNYRSEKTGQQGNHPPVVKIITPKTNSVFNWDTPINYKISVSDKEDGDSRFDEINVKEVLLAVRYIGKKSPASPQINKAQNDAAGLAIMRTSNCFNCHNFNSKSIGPSFYEINKRYPATLHNTDSLEKHVRQGSSGIWGKEKMPTHPELTVAETKSAIQWILKNAGNPDVNYFFGVEGVFRIKRPVAANQKAFYSITASYINHGVKNTPSGTRLKAEDAVIIHRGE